MAKKAVGKVKSGEKSQWAKIIVPTRSPKTGAYTFQERIILREDIKSYLEKKNK
jgi:hypothetical protein